MNNIFLIMGETARGKDTLVKMLNKRGLKSVCSCTTRPKRECETDGVEHLFIDDKTADRLLEDDENIIAKTQIGKYRYFATKDEFDNSDIYVIDPNGAEYLLDKFNDINPTIVYVTCREHTAIDRAQKRGDDIEVIKERIKAENEQFVDLEQRFDGYDFIRFDNDFDIGELEEFADKLFDIYVDNCWTDLYTMKEVLSAIIKNDLELSDIGKEEFVRVIDRLIDVYWN